MSQKKVDQYKEYKKNRKEILAKEKRKRLAGKITAWVILIAAAGGLTAAVGVSIHNSYKAKEAAKPNYAMTDFGIPDYASIRQADEEEEAAGTEEAGESVAVSEEETDVQQENTDSETEALSEVENEQEN